MNPTTSTTSATPTLAPEAAAWLEQTFARNHARFGGWSMEDTGGDPAAGDPSGGGGGKEGETFTQADVDKLVGKARREERGKATREAAEKYADYDDLKVKADGAKSLEDRLNDLETKGTAATQRALRAEIAAEFGISTKRGENDEASDAELFLTATDEAGLRKQAERLAKSKKHNVSPHEGQHGKPKAADSMRGFTRGLFGRDDS